MAVGGRGDGGREKVDIGDVHALKAYFRHNNIEGHSDDTWVLSEFKYYTLFSNDGKNN